MDQVIVKDLKVARTCSMRLYSYNKSAINSAHRFNMMELDMRRLIGISLAKLLHSFCEDWRSTCRHSYQAYQKSSDALYSGQAEYVGYSCTSLRGSVENS